MKQWPQRLSRFVKFQCKANFIKGTGRSKNLFIGVPVEPGEKGIEDIIEINLAEEEERPFIYQLLPYKSSRMICKEASCQSEQSFFP